MTETCTGSCQCGAVAWEAEADISNPIACNCSRCRRLGSVLVFTPREQFRLLKGEGDLSEYRFNKGVIRHLFCKTCGIESFAFGQLPDGTEMAALNLNCMDGVDARAMTPHVHDGASA
ncbi:MAG: GFA family protein [Paracoccaceae bacterium]